MTRAAGLLIVSVSCCLCSVLSAAEIEPFDLKNPPLPEPGKKYRLVIEPGKKAKRVTLLFVADTQLAMDPTEESKGKSWTGINSIVQVL